MLLGGEYPLRSTGYPLNPPVATAHSLGNFMRSQPASRPADQMQPQLLASTTLLVFVIEAAIARLDLIEQAI
ncbi:unnamed protein product, partial [Clonostachys rosea f. rosea IK726]